MYLYIAYSGAHKMVDEIAPETTGQFVTKPRVRAVGRLNTLRTVTLLPDTHIWGVLMGDLRISVQWEGTEGSRHQRPKQACPRISR